MVYNYRSNIYMLQTYIYNVINTHTYLVTNAKHA